MKISIIIPVKNGLPYFREVIEEVLKQECNFDFEVIVIDSGSTDGSLELAKNNQHVRLFEIPSTEYGHGKTRNYGASQSNAEYLCFITHDAVPDNKHWLKELIKPMEEDSEVAGVFGRHKAHLDACDYTKAELDAHFDGLKAFPLVQILDAKEYVENQGLRQIYHFYSDNSSAMRRAIWNEHPYPDVNFAEDQLWAKKIVELGYKKAYAHESIVRHSHDYTLLDSMRRSIDESKAFKKYFGYTLCSSLKRAFKDGLYKTKNDNKNLKKHDFHRPSTYLRSKRLLRNYFIKIGHYIGTKNIEENSKLDTFLSVDKRLKKS